MTQETINRLMELKQLYEQGILTQEEMETEKQKILRAAEPASEKSPQGQPPFVDSHAVQPDSQEKPEPKAADIVKEEPEGNTEMLKIVVVVLAILLLGVIAYACSHKNSSNNDEWEAIDSVCVDTAYADYAYSSDMADDEYYYSSDMADDEFVDETLMYGYVDDEYQN